METWFLNSIKLKWQRNKQIYDGEKKRSKIMFYRCLIVTLRDFFLVVFLALKVEFECKIQMLRSSETEKYEFVKLSFNICCLS